MIQEREIKIENITGGYLVTSIDGGSLVQRFPIEGEWESKETKAKIHAVLGALVMSLTNERTFTLVVEDDSIR